MSHGIDWAAMAGVVNIEDRHKDIVDRLDDTPFEQHHFVAPIHWPVFHVFADSGDQMDTLSIVMFEVFADVALIAKTFSLDESKELVQNPFSIIHNVARSNYKIHDFTYIVDNQMYF